MDPETTHRTVTVDGVTLDLWKEHPTANIPGLDHLRDAHAFVREQSGYWCAYEMGQAYGGPEEGGWWYDTGSLRAAVPAMRVVAVFDRHSPDAEIRHLAHLPCPAKDAITAEWLADDVDIDGPDYQSHSRRITIHWYWCEEIELGFPSKRPRYE